MNSPTLVAVEATDERYRALTHQPSGLPITERWPADAFTWRLRDEGAIRIVADLPDIQEQPLADSTKPPRKDR